MSKTAIIVLKLNKVIDKTDNASLEAGIRAWLANVIFSTTYIESVERVVVSDV